MLRATTRSKGTIKNRATTRRKLKSDPVQRLEQPHDLKARGLPIKGNLLAHRLSAGTISISPAIRNGRPGPPREIIPMRKRFPPPELAGSSGHQRRGVRDRQSEGLERREVIMLKIVLTRIAGSIPHLRRSLSNYGFQVVRSLTCKVRTSGRPGHAPSGRADTPRGMTPRVFAALIGVSLSSALTSECGHRRGCRSSRPWRYPPARGGGGQPGSGEAGEIGLCRLVLHDADTQLAGTSSYWCPSRRSESRPRPAAGGSLGRIVVGGERRILLRVIE